MATYDLASVSAPAATSIAVGDIIECSYCGAQKSVTLPKGLYKLECWGAQGGDGCYSTYSASSTYLFPGGKGGYSAGELSLSSNTTVYLSAGGKGGYTTAANTNQGAGWNGGGAARTASTSYVHGGGGGGSDIRVAGTGLYNRVIVAGGGGGSANYYGYATSNATTYGGGYGGGLTGKTATAQYSTGGGGGSQTAVGICYYGGSNVTTNTSYFNPVSSFGTAGTPTASQSYSSGGGGGWYPGGASYLDSAGGGSGYVYTSDTASNYPGTKPSTAYYLTNARTLDGSVSFTAPSGGSETGHSGNGFVRIRVLALNYYDIGTSTAPAATAIRTGDLIRCSYCGAAKSISLPVGEYKLECWGAQGGAAYQNNSTDQGGKGGYSSGILTLNAVTTVYLYTGGKGKYGYSTVGTVAGGWNGGGAGCITIANNVSYAKGSGGGASDIRIGGQTTNNRIIVAGGGGGSVYSGVNYQGGWGGGASGQNGKQWSYTGGTGGSQTSAGISYYNSAAGNATYLTEAGFGTGGGAKTTGVSCAGGGGGWYGGGASCSSSYSHGSGGGGSGYVYTAATAGDYPGTKPSTSYYLGAASTTTNTQEGDGLIHITVIKAFQPVTAPSLSNTSKTYNGASQSPTESGYDTAKMTRSGTFSAIMPGTYSVTYSLKDGYIWSDGTLNSKTFTWSITSNWRRVNAWVYDNTV